MLWVPPATASTYAVRADWDSDSIALEPARPPLECTALSSAGESLELRESVSRLVNTAAKSAVPNEPPTERKNVRVPLATPMSFSSTLFWVMTMTFWNSRPRPMPKTTM